MNIKINRETPLSKPNVNGIIYEHNSLTKAINEFLKRFEGLDTPNVCVYRGYNIYDEYFFIKPEHILGKCINIYDDYIEVDILNNKIDLYNSMANPIAMFRMICGFSQKESDRTIAFIDKIIAIDINEKCLSHSWMNNHYR
jgi:hypothetical protein